ncbi:MAG TPA: hypothetical protein DHV37_05855 [Erysipelotrichaceae bacterium]|nr:hypothetical protein [Erysipelotrichaceae bacterium]
MALTDENSMVMPVTPMYGGCNGGFGSGFGGDWGWIILLLLIAGNGWGNGFGGFGGGVGGFAADGAMLYPWMNQANLTSNGFQNQMLNDNVTSIRDGIHDISTQLCNGFGNVQMSLANGFAGVEQGANTRQIANMQQAFANQTAMMQGFNNVQSQFADCCCENRLANCQTQNIIQNEGNQTRFADANNTRDLLTNQTANTQAILDKLCQLELDGKNTRIADLERQLTVANLKESQTAQNAFISQGFADEVDQLYNRLSSCPVPSVPVYGKTNIFSCNNNGCGCGCGNGGF